MKKISLTVMALILCAALLGGCSEANAPMPDNISASLSPAQNNVSSSVPAELLALRFDGYENMTILEYRTKATGIIMENETEYLALIEHVAADSIIQEMRYSNADAYFVANILIPTVAEKWKTWRFSNASTSDANMAEYTISYSILNAENITMGGRNQAIASVMDGIQEVLDNRTDEQLADEAGTKAALDTKINDLTTQFTAESFRIEVDLSYRAENIASSEQPDGRMEERGEVGTAADYELLLSLTTDGYKNTSVSDFLQSYTVLAQNQDFQEAYTRVSRDIFLDDVQVDITAEEISFLAITLEATSQEFIAKYQNNYKRPTLRYRIEKQRSEIINGHDNIVFDLFVDYSIVYSVQDDTGLTVGKRDAILIAIRNDMQNFVDSRTEDELTNGQSELDAEIEKLEQHYSNSEIQLKISIISYHTNDQSEDVQAMQ